MELCNLFTDDSLGRQTEFRIAESDGNRFHADPLHSVVIASHHCSDFAGLYYIGNDVNTFATDQF